MHVDTWPPVAKKSMKELQQVGFRIRDEVFAKAKFQVGFNSSKLENIYRDAFGEDLTMDAVKYPRYAGLFANMLYAIGYMLGLPWS